MNITKAIADEAANMMAQKAFEDEIKEAHDLIRGAYEDVIKLHIPAEVIAAVNKFPTWLTGSKSVYYYWNGSSYYEDLSYYVPHSSRNIKELLDVDEKKYIEEKLKILQNVLIKCSNFKEKCYYNLCSLKTRNRIEEIFPEAMEYIQWPSEPIKNLPAAQLEELRFALQKCRKG